jgi:N-acetylglucosamine kinase-like BadF-type ATPase
VSGRVVLAADGGGSKTDLALVREDGDVLAFVRGGSSSPQNLGMSAAFAVLEQLVDQAVEEVGIELPVDVARLFLAGIDLPADAVRATEEAARRGWARTTAVDNDTFAILRAGSETGWGVAVVCGAGINCVGVAPDGRHARFPALGWTSGDWGGGGDVGTAAVSAAARSEDGRGPRTTLERVVPAHFGLRTPSELAEAFHYRRIETTRVGELAPVVLAEAVDDPVAAEIRDRLAGEVATLAATALRRLDLLDAEVEVVLGGGLLQAGDSGLLSGIEGRLRAIAARTVIRVCDLPPIVGAALAGLDDLGATPEAHRRLRESDLRAREVSRG